MEPKFQHIMLVNEIYRENDPSILLKGKIVDKIRQNGPITFAEFMHDSLYDGEFGFFSAGRAKFAGDRDGESLVTSPEQSPLFGRIIAGHIYQSWDVMGRPERFDVVEMGAGTGRLAREIVKFAKHAMPEFYPHLQYSIVEISEALIAQQQQALTGENITWVRGSATDPHPRKVEGVFLSNELVDNLPFHLVVMENGELKEIFVGEDEGKLVEIRQQPSSEAVATYLNNQKVELQEGQIAWVCLEALKWMREVGSALQRGFVITIDYGDQAQALYRPLSLWNQLANFSLGVKDSTGGKAIFSKPGKYDITAPVNFTALINEGKKVGLEPIGFMNQPGYLNKLGLTGAIENMYKKLPIDPEQRIAILLMIKSAEFILADKAGWKVLVQEKTALSSR